MNGPKFSPFSYDSLSWKTLTAIHQVSLIVMHRVAGHPACSQVEAVRCPLIRLKSVSAVVSPGSS